MLYTYQMQLFRIRLDSFLRNRSFVSHAQGHIPVFQIRSTEHMTSPSTYQFVGCCV